MNINLKTMNADEKIDLFMMNFADYCEENLGEEDIKTQIFMQFLAVVKLYNFFEKSFSFINRNVPELITKEKNLIWDYFITGKYSDETGKFGDLCNEIAMMLNTGEGMSYEADLLWNENAKEWEDNFNLNECVLLFTDISWIFWQINNKKIDWNMIGDMINNMMEMIGSYLEEDVYNNGTNGMTAKEYDIWERDVCSSETFELFAGQLLECLSDGKEKDISGLKEKYASEMFLNETCAMKFAEALEQDF